MSESLSIDEGWEEPLDSDQVTHVRGEVTGAAAPAGEWLVNVSEQVIVPMTSTDIVEALRSRRVTDRSLVWRAGMQDWSPLGDVPQLRLAAGALVSSQRNPAIERSTPPVSDRLLHPPPKEPARAARDERVRRNTLPFGFPVVRDPATIREPSGLNTAPASNRTAPAPKRAPIEDRGALAIYERATPSLTFSDSVRAEWQGTRNLVHQPAPNAPPPVIARPSASARPEPKPEPRAEPRRLSLEPQSDRRPRLTLEPQSDPMQSARPEPQFKAPSSQPPSSFAPTTSEPNDRLPARGAGMWGDLSVVLASDMRAVQASSKRVTLIASLASAALASLLTLWFAHSSTRHRSEPTVRAQAAPVVPPPTAQVTPALVMPVSAPPSALPAPVASSAHSAGAASRPLVARATPKPSVVAPARVVARPKPSLAVDADHPVPASVADGDPYADPAEHSPPKTPTAAFKETSAASAPSADVKTVNPSKMPSGLEDNAPAVHPAPTAAPGF